MGGELVGVLGKLGDDVAYLGEVVADGAHGGDPQEVALAGVVRHGARERERERKREGGRGEWMAVERMGNKWVWSGTEERGEGVVVVVVGAR